MSNGSDSHTSARFSWKRAWLPLVFSLALFVGVAVYSKYIQLIPFPGVALVIGIVYAAMAGGVRAGLICTGLMAGLMAITTAFPKLGVPVESTPVRLVIFTFFGVACAITFATLIERVRRAEAKRARDERAIFRIVMENLHDAVIECDWKGIREVNASVCRMTGFSREELIGTTPPYPFWPAEEFSRLAASMEQAMRGQALDFELVLVRKSGERFPVLMSVSHFDGGDASSARTVYTIRDITDLKRVQKSLETSEARLEEAINTARLAIWEWEVATDLVVWNSHARVMFGLPPEKPAGTLSDFFKRVHPEDVERLKAEQEANIRAKRGFEYRFRIVREGGDVVTVQGRGHCTVSETGVLQRMSGVCYVVELAK